MKINQAMFIGLCSSQRRSALQLDQVMVFWVCLDLVRQLVPLLRIELENASIWATKTKTNFAGWLTSCMCAKYALFDSRVLWDGWLVPLLQYVCMGI